MRPALGNERYTKTHSFFAQNPGCSLPVFLNFTNKMLGFRHEDKFVSIFVAVRFHHARPIYTFWKHGRPNPGFAADTPAPEYLRTQKNFKKPLAIIFASDILTAPLPLKGADSMFADR
jgi:hypothetical protein